MKNILYLTLLLGIFRTGVSQELTPYEYYKNYSFRRCIVNLTNKNKQASFDNYIIANSFFKLKDYSNALQYFSKVDFDSFSNQVFRDSYLYFYSSCLKEAIEKDQSLINYINTNFLVFYSNNIYIEEIEKNYLYSYWKTKNFNAILKHNFITSNLTFYSNLASIFVTNNLFEEKMLNLENIEIQKFSILLEHYDSIDKKIISNLEQRNFENLISYLVKNKKYNELEKILDEYKKFGESDFYYRNFAFLRYNLGYKNEAINFLENYIQKGQRVSWNSFKIFIDLLLKEKMDEKAYSFMKKYKDFYGSAYYEYWIRILKRTNRYKELYNWFEKISAKVSILPEYEREVFRTLLRNNLNLAKQMAISYKGRNSFYYTYSLALINYQQKNYASAYKNFLKIVVNHPFTYEWIVSLKYEKELREKYKKTFQETINTKITSLISRKSFSKDDILFYKAIDFYYPETKQKYKTLFKRLENALLNFQNNFSNNIVRKNETDEKFKKFLELESRLPEYMCVERIKLLENVFNKKYNFSLFYDNYNYFTNRGMEHYIVSYLNGFFINYLDKKDYFMLLTKDELLKIFPTNHLSKIESYINDRKMALYSISFIREESHFRKEVVSWANAIGIAQIIPPTFAMIKNAMKIDINIYDFDDNLFAGIYHFKYLLNKYKGNIVFAIAAYNSGEGSVNRWKKNYNYIDELWTECVEYNETYFYIRKIVFSQFIYNYILSDWLSCPIDNER